MTESTESLTVPKINVILLRNKLGKRLEDRYMVDVAVALQSAGHNVTIYAAEFDPSNCFVEVDPDKGSINVEYTGSWIPKSFKVLRAIVMAFRMILFPPKPRPHMIILDINTIGLYVLTLFSLYKKVYVCHFASIRQAEIHTKYMKIVSDLVSAKALKNVDDIVVQSDALGDVFRRSFPNVKKELKCIPPCVDTGVWVEPIIDIARIVPDLPKPSLLFVCFGAYRARSNFKLVLEAFEDLLMISSAHVRNNIHLVIAGNCNDLHIEQKIFYNELLEKAKEKPYASQVSFLKRVPKTHRKTLIDACIAVIVPSKYDAFPDTILPVLAAGRPLIATNTGFAKEAVRHRISAILVEPTPHMFAAAMFKLLTNPNIQVFLSDMSQDVFRKRYSNSVFKRRVCGIVTQYAVELAQLKQN